MPKLAKLADFSGAISFVSGTEVKPGLCAGGRNGAARRAAAWASFTDGTYGTYGTNEIDPLVS